MTCPRRISNGRTTGLVAEAIGAGVADVGGSTAGSAARRASDPQRTSGSHQRGWVTARRGQRESRKVGKWESEKLGAGALPTGPLSDFPTCGLCPIYGPFGSVIHSNVSFT